MPKKRVRDLAKQAVYQKRWYESHKRAHVANVMRRKRQMAEDGYQKLFAYLSDHPCVDCGEKDVVVLEFDHVRGKKSANVVHLIVRGYLWESVEKEIAKCEVRCCNCHRRATTRRAGWRRHTYALLAQ